MNEELNNNGNIIIYQTADGLTKIDVKVENDTVWLSLDQMAELFQRNKSTISRHIRNIFEEGELNREVVVAKNATTTQHGAIERKQQTHWVDYYNLDVIISVGYRVKSVRGTQFRIWATQRLKEYLIKGCVCCLDSPIQDTSIYRTPRDTRIRDVCRGRGRRWRSCAP